MLRNRKRLPDNFVGAPVKVFVTAGEPSGDALGAELIKGLKALVPGLDLRGIAGPRMQAAGMGSIFPMEELSVMGIAEILPKFFQLKRRIRQTAEVAIEWQPDVVITIDSPDFSLRVAKIIKERANLRTVHYVAPTVWAWRPARAVKMAKVIDHVLALFPFEPPYMKEAGMACDFVGHPVAAHTRPTEAQIAAFRAEYGLDDRPVVAVLPGSRKSEVRRLLPVFGTALAQSRLAAAHIILPTLSHLVPMVRELGSALPRPPILITREDADAAAQERRIAMSAADIALAASGTVSLELAAARTPMVIAYDMNWLTKKIVQRKLLIDTVTLVNLVSETRTVPECIGETCTPDQISTTLDAVFAERGRQLDAMETTMQRLGEGGDAPGLRAAKAVLDRLPPAG